MIVVVLLPSGAIMGKLGKNHDTWELHEPRTVEIVQGPQGQVGVRLSHLIGAPPCLFLGSSVTYYIPKDEQIVNMYVESVSQIKIASVLPRLKQ